MYYKTTLIKLYYLLVSADGTVNDREISAGRQMIKAEGISEFDFNRVQDSLRKRNSGVVYSECLEELKKLSHENQVRCIAWMCVIANADGFMDKTEWHFIYTLYHAELALQLDEIMKEQKKLIGLKEKPLLLTVL
jgi:uncharacterized tellurite resistance protein B-like protein